MSDDEKPSPEQKEALSLFETLPTFVASGFIPCTPLFDVGIDLVVFKEMKNSPDIILKIQAKSRFTLNKKYFGRDIWMLFPNAPKTGPREFFFCPHDQMIEMVDSDMKTSDSWINKDGYSQAFDISNPRFSFLEDYRFSDVLCQLSESRFKIRKTATSWLVQ
jgi:hypothetical protein